MFNEHQEAYMEMLAKIPAEQKCYCGWYKLGECQNHCDPTKTNADKIKDYADRLMLVRSADLENNPDSGPLRLTCIACGEETEYRCPFCEIYARKRVGLCGRSECREEHEDIDCIRNPKGKQ